MLHLLFVVAVFLAISNFEHLQQYVSCSSQPSDESTKCNKSLCMSMQLNIKYNRAGLGKSSFKRDIFMTPSNHSWLLDQKNELKALKSTPFMKFHRPEEDCFSSTNEANKISCMASVLSNANKECIVNYVGYYSNDYRQKLLVNTLLGCQISQIHFRISQRNNPAARFPSDFDVVVVEDTYYLQVFMCLGKSPLVKRVTPQRKIIRNVKSANEKNFDSNGIHFHQGTSSTYDDIDSIPGRHVLYIQTEHITKLIHAHWFWHAGFTGKNVKVAVFDTGLPEENPYFRNITEQTNWTHEKMMKDGLGHGTFVAGVIGSTVAECPGIAPDSELHIFRVFTDNQVSYTSWFLDAFNYAILKKVNIINLSIGGPDFKDLPFVDKVWELTANGVIMVSAIGNDGPLYGTLNNPADQMDVIGVGGIDYDDSISSFSSRGMTTWELPRGYGRVKPDIVTYGSSVKGLSLNGRCKSLSGTSVASPVIAGAIALLYSAVPKEKRDILSPASIKQVLLAAAERLPKFNIFEQGNGKLNLVEAYKVLNRYIPQASLIPSYIDFTDCPFMWPYCTQPLYYGGLPITVNVTILNGMAVTGWLRKNPTWHPYKDKFGHNIEVSFSYSEYLWPWSGFLALSFSVVKSATHWEGEAHGHVELVVVSPSREDDQTLLSSQLTLPVIVKVIPTPPKDKRLLWDQFHNLRYPPGYIPRDNLRLKEDPLDWNGDHIHTNFRDLYQHLRNSGYYIETLGQPYTCFNASKYGALLIIDPEEEFFPEEVEKLKHDVFYQKLNIIVFADWYNTSVMEKINFYDENTRKWWMPETGGSNLPALNTLLKPYGIAFSGSVYEGNFVWGEHSMYFASGTTIARFPIERGGKVFYRHLKDQATEILTGKSLPPHQVPLLGFHQVKSKGRIAIYGDSNCLDLAHQVKKCYWLMDAMLQYAFQGVISPVFEVVAQDAPFNNELLKSALFTYEDGLPMRGDGNHFYRYSKVSSNAGGNKYLQLPKCSRMMKADILSLSTSLLPQISKVHKLILEEHELKSEKNLKSLFQATKTATSRHGENLFLPRLHSHYKIPPSLKQILTKLVARTSLHSLRFSSVIPFRNSMLMFLLILIIVGIYLLQLQNRRRSRKWVQLKTAIWWLFIGWWKIVISLLRRFFVVAHSRRHMPRSLRSLNVRSPDQTTPSAVISVPPSGYKSISETSGCSITE